MFTAACDWSVRPKKQKKQSLLSPYSLHRRPLFKADGASLLMVVKPSLHLTARALRQGACTFVCVNQVYLHETPDVDDYSCVCALIIM